MTKMIKNILVTSLLFTSYVLASDIKPVPFVVVKNDSAEYSAICNSVKKYLVNMIRQRYGRKKTTQMRFS